MEAILKIHPTIKQMLQLLLIYSNAAWSSCQLIVPNVQAHVKVSLEFSMRFLHLFFPSALVGNAFAQTAIVSLQNNRIEQAGCAPKVEQRGSRRPRPRLTVIRSFTSAPTQLGENAVHQSLLRIAVSPPIG